MARQDEARDDLCARIFESAHLVRELVRRHLEEARWDFTVPVLGHPPRKARPRVRKGLPRRIVDVERADDLVGADAVPHREEVLDDLRRAPKEMERVGETLLRKVLRRRST